jgi:hypothetical protein
MHKRACALILSILIGHGQMASSFAQTSMATPPEQLSALRSDIQDLKSQNQRIEASLQQLTAAVGQLQTASLYSTEEGKKQAAKNAAEKKGEAENAVKSIDDISEKVLGTDLKGKIKDCIAKLNIDGAKLLEKNPEAIANPLVACNDATVKNLQQELEKKRDQLLSTWNKCRNTLSLANPDLGLSIPDVPANLTAQNIRQIQTNIEDAAKKLSDVGQNAGQCVSEMQDSIRGLGDVAKAGGALSAALGFAAQACFASGANPYVCAGFAVLAILMSLFGNGNGNGDGNGNGKGNGEGNGNSAVGLPGNAGVPGPPAEPVTTNFSGDNRSDGVLCNRLEMRLTCWTSKKPEIKTIMDFAQPDPGTANSDSARWFKEILTAGGSNGRLFFCSDPSGRIVRTIVSSQDKKSQALVDVSEAEDKASKAHALVFNTKTEQHDPGSEEQLCPP